MATVSTRPNERRSDWHESDQVTLTLEPAGWVTRSVPYPMANGHEPLAVHGQWRGPHKLTTGEHGCLHISELFIHRDVEDEGLFGDEDQSGGRQQLIERLVDGPLSADPQLPFDHWQPPEASVMESQLRASGYEPTVDDEQNLRLTLKSRGAVGQVMIRRTDGRLQLDMPLGQWTGLDALRTDAMLQIARRQNHSMRLVRITWDAVDCSSRCCAQVDLSGLPLEAEYTSLWSDMLRMAITGLELALHQLGKELDVLADARHAHIARWLVANNQQGG